MVGGGADHDTRGELEQHIAGPLKRAVCSPGHSGFIVRRKQCAFLVAVPGLDLRAYPQVRFLVKKMEARKSSVAAVCNRRKPILK